MLGLTTLPLLLVGAALAAAKDMPQLFPDPQGLSVLNAGFRTIPPAGVRYINTEGWKEKMPEDCAKEALAIQDDGKPRCPLNQLDVFTVHYTDVPDDVAWLFCRCKNADYSQQTLIDEFGRIPVAIRQRVRYVMNFKGTSGGASNRNDLMLMEVSPTVIMHEAAHAFDDAGSRSGTVHYNSAINADSCWADGYAQRQGQAGNRADPWAQVLIIRRYLLQVGQASFPKSNAELACLYNQLYVVASQTDQLIKEGFSYALKRDYGAIGKRSDYTTQAMGSAKNSAKFRF